MLSAIFQFGLDYRLNGTDEDTEQRHNAFGANEVRHVR
jgi:hypothetical protein